MIDFFKNIWKSIKSDDVSDNNKGAFSLLRKALPKDFDLDNVLQITSLFSIEYKESIHKELKEATKNNLLESVSKKYNFNVLEDAIEVFLFEMKNGTSSIYLLFSPVELYENEYLLDVIGFTYKINKEDFIDRKIVF